MSKIIYLDYAAATPMDKDVIKIMEPYYSKYFYNPSASNLLSLQVKKDLNEARALVAHYLGAKSQEVIFTAGSTEANNLAIQGVMNKYPKANMLISEIEHESVLETAKNYEYLTIKVNKDGSLNLQDLETKMNDNTVLVSVMMANNIIGTIEPLRQTSAIIEKVRLNRKSKFPLYFHSDAAQGANYLDLHANRLGVDLLSVDGSKVYGPKQTGCLYVNSDVSLKPLIYGGGQESGLRSGTENVAGSIGFAFALDKAQKLRDKESSRLHDLSSFFIAECLNNITGSFLNGPNNHRLPNNVHLTFPGTDAERLLLQLESRGIIAALGSACSASQNKVPTVLKAIGLSDKDANSSLRFSMGRGSNKADIKKVVKTLVELIKQ